MRRSGLAIILSLAPLVLTACSWFLHATLFNNTGQAIKLDSDSGGGIAPIAPNQFVQFRYPEELYNGVLRLSSAGCAYLYDVPPKLADYGYDPKVDRGVQIQVEKDFSIDLLSVSYAGDTPASGAVILQREGFPLRPVSRKCR